MNVSWRLVATALPVLAACIGGEPEPGRVPVALAASPPQVLSDSLVLTAPGGITVWLTEGRASADSQGTWCVERSIEIRRDTARLKVPLLYTLNPPVLLDDSTVRAELANGCRPRRSYRVDLRTARPSPIESRESQ